MQTLVGWQGWLYRLLAQVPERKVLMCKTCGCSSCSGRSNSSKMTKTGSKKKVKVKKKTY